MFELPQSRESLKEAFKNSDMAKRVSNMESLSEDLKKLYLELSFESFCDGATHISRLANINNTIRESRLVEEGDQKR